jgi:hypothetical protein
MPYLIAAIASAFLVGGVLLLQRKLAAEGGDAGTGDYTSPSLIDPSTTRREAPVLARSVEAAGSAVLTATDTSQPVGLLHLFTPQQRKHTCMAGATGDGKTATMNTLLVADIASGAHCVVCSTHFTAYHPEDQPIDLRPIQHLFEVAYTLPTIASAIAAVVAEKDRRMELYRAGQPVGQDIVLYLGEWGAILRALGKGASDTLAGLLDEGRKTRVWIVIEYHSMLVGRTGGDSALREQYKTRLVGNVDKTTWDVAVGKTIPQVTVPLGSWMTDRGVVRVARPTADYIARLSTRRPAFSATLAPAVSTVTDDDLWLSSELEPLPAATDTEVRRLAVSIDRTGSDSGEVSIFEGEPMTGRTGSAPTATNEIAHPNAVKPVRDDLPQDELSVAIRALVQAGISRTRAIDLLSIGGGKAVALKRIKTALGETE